MSDVDRTDSTSWSLGTLRKYLETKIEAVEAAARAAQTASDKAISKSENAADVRAASQNEFRGALDDQAKGLATKTQVEQIEIQLRTFALKSELYARLDAGDRRLEDLKTALEKRIDAAESNQERGAGRNQGIALVLASAATFVSIASALYAVFKH